MSFSNGLDHGHEDNSATPFSQALGVDSPSSNLSNLDHDTYIANGDLSHPNGSDDSIMQDMDDNDDDEDASGEEDDEYDDGMQEQATTRQSKRSSLSSESSSRSSKRKRNADDEDDYVLANPTLYGLRRSGRAKPARSLTEDDDEDDDVVPSVRKRQKVSKNMLSRASRKSTAAPSEQNNSQGEDEDDDDDIYGGARARATAKKHRRKLQAGGSRDDTPLTGEIRFSNRRTGKVTNYNEDQQNDDDDLEDEEEGYYGAEAEDTGPKIDAVVNHKLNEGASADSENHADYQFLVKWEGQAYYHATWEDWQSLSPYQGVRKRDNYWKKTVLMDIEMTQDPDTPLEEREQWLLDREVKLEELAQWSIIERIINRRNTYSGLEYLVKWKALQYKDCTWEPASLLSEIAPDAVDKYLDRASRLPSSNKKESNLSTRTRHTLIPSQPAYIQGGKLREFQLKGINFLAAHWCNGDNVILADEMGLGKTVQTVGFCNWLHHDRGQEGPFLIVVPLSTLPAWQDTFTLWAPDLNVISYSGTSQSREIIRTNEIFVNGDTRKVNFNVMISTYEFVNMDVAELSKVKWQFLAVDEAHRLKNRDNLLYGNLLALDCPSRLLITGTPLQNQLSELGALMDFLMPGKISVDAKLDLTDANAANKIAQLAEAIKPYLLRRTKAKVESDLPPKAEKIIRIELSDTQLELYKNLLARDYDALTADGTHKPSLLNLVMELKKCSNHAFLFPNTEEKVLGSNQLSRGETLNAYIQHSGKMIVLDRLLAKLKAEGHRVLIFSQMVGMLNILGAYCGLSGHQYQRLDGTVPANARKLAIDHFNAPDSQDFIFLLSTRAGGLGINLMTADTVIIFDSDWNPQADLQAMARAHRIGQKKPVTVYRFASKDTIEEDILERARNKLMLEYLTIHRGVTDNAAGTKHLHDQFLNAGKLSNEATSHDDISRILAKRGQKMFEKTGSQKKLEELDIDDVLANAEEADTKAQEGIASDNGEDFLKSFEYTDIKIDAWAAIIPKDQLDKAGTDKAEQESNRAIAKESRKRKAEEDARDQRAAKKRARMLTADAIEDDSSDEEDAHGDPARALNEKECRNLVKAFERYGSMDEMEKEVLREARLVNRDPAVVKATLKQILDKADELIADEKQRIEDLEKDTGRPATKKDHKTVLFDFNGVKRLNAETLAERPGDLSMIRAQVKAADSELRFRISEAVKPASYSCEWGAREDGMLLIGISRHGYGAWSVIRDDLELGLEDKLFLEEHRIGNKTARNEAEDKKNAKSPGAVHLVRRTAYLISVLRDKTSGGADQQAKKALENHHRNNRKTGSGRARAASPKNGSGTPLSRPMKNGDRSKDHKNGTHRHEKLSSTNGVSKSTHATDVKKSVKRRLSKERTSSKDHRRKESTVSQDVDRTRPTWNVERATTIFDSMATQLLEVKGATAKRYPEKQERLDVLKKGVLAVGDHITRHSDPKSRVTDEDLWMHVVFFHWPKKQKDSASQVAAALQQQYKKLCQQRAELESGKPAAAAKPEGPKLSQLRTCRPSNGCRERERGGGEEEGGRS
ncbi:hypothetical protein AMS68_007765 [Peltaster fructicola]|uniref:Uncharacterized protein n=1 Tax=Peltaster fructicola TaxID=286661 RepID=A0A6H0Y5X8_9PEZI|nr:hypothetical protein AMS68_007765 [Peltaster fructicola]